MHLASKCHCCDKYEEETMQPLFLTTPLAKKSWGQFTTCAEIQVNEGLKQMIWSCWEVEAPLKPKVILSVVLAVMMWELWKRRNAWRYGKEVTLYKLRRNCMNLLQRLAKKKLPLD